MSKKLFDFEAEFKLGIESVDNEHITLVEMLNDVHNLLSEGKKDEARRYFSETLSGYVNEHFANEEKFMESFGFPGIEEHKKIHANYRASFNNMLPLIETYDETAFRSALTDAFTWIISHIGKTDKRYAKYYLEKQGS